MKKAGVTSAPSEAGYYIFPDFEVCRNALIQKGITSGHKMCAEIMDKKNVAVSKFIFLIHYEKMHFKTFNCLFSTYKTLFPF